MSARSDRRLANEYDRARGYDLPPHLRPGVNLTRSQPMNIIVHAMNGPSGHHVATDWDVDEHRNLVLTSDGTLVAVYAAGNWVSFSEHEALPGANNGE